MHKTSLISRTLAGGLAAAVGMALLGAPPATANSGPQPTFVRTIGGPGHATMYPSGAEVDWSTTDGTLGAYVVADTGNDHIKKYDSNGNLLWDVGGSGVKTSPLQFNDPRDVGVDQLGNVYVADTSNVRIVKLDPNGNYLTSWKGLGVDKIGSPMGVTVSLYDQHVYVADAGKRVVRVYDPNGNLLHTFGMITGTCALTNFRDVDAGPGGNIYIANYTKNNVVELDSTGACVRKWGTKGSGNGQFMNPYGVRVAPDPVRGIDAVFIADSNNDRVQEFDLNGNFLAKFGTADTDCTHADQFCALRRVAVGPARTTGCPNAAPKCFQVVGADLWGWKIEPWTSDGLGGYIAPSGWSQDIPGSLSPPPGATPLNLFVGGTSPTSVFNRARQVAIAPDGSLRIMDSVNQRIVWMGPNGVLSTGTSWVNGSNPATEQNTCGKRGWDPGSFNWPRGIAIDNATGDMWVADTKQSYLQVIHADCTGATVLGKQGPALNQFNWPYQVAIRQSDRIAFVADTINGRVVAYDVATKTPLVAYGTKGTGTGQFTNPSGIAVGPNGDVFVADETNNRIVELSYNSSSKVFAWVGSYTGGGALKKPDGVSLDAGGKMYIADTVHNQLVVLNGDGSLYAVMKPTLANALLTPESVTFDTLNKCIYVSDTYHDRIQVYTYDTGSCT
jgi:sugar lactone lactonase YvrE